MKTNLFALLLLAVTLNGCASNRSATFNPHDLNGITHSDRNLSFFAQAISPTEMAIAYAIIKDADTRAAMFSNFTSARQNGKKQYVGLIINEDVRRTARVNHPELSTILVIKPGAHEFFLANEIPDEISVLFDGESQIKRLKLHKQDKTYDGVAINFGARIFD